MKHSIFSRKMVLEFGAVLLFFSGSVLSCRSTKIEIPDDATAKQLIQDGQNAYESGDYKTAQVYYDTVIERFGDDTSTYVEARYEIAHLYIKEKKYEKAQPVLEEILDIFKNATPGTLPAAYEKLAEIELAKLPSNKANTAASDQQNQSETEASADTPDEY